MGWRVGVIARAGISRAGAGVVARSTFVDISGAAVLRPRLTAMGFLLCAGAAAVMSSVRGFPVEADASKSSSVMASRWSRLASQRARIMMFSTDLIYELVCCALLTIRFRERSLRP